MRPRSRTRRVQRGARRLRAAGRTQRPRTERPARSRRTRKVTLAASDSVIETRVPPRADSAGPDRAARNIGGVRRREIDGATMSPVSADEDGAPGVTGGGVLGPAGEASLLTSPN